MAELYGLAANGPSPLFACVAPIWAVAARTSKRSGRASERQPSGAGGHRAHNGACRRLNAAAPLARNRQVGARSGKLGPGVASGRRV